MILEEIAAYASKRVENAKKLISMKEIQKSAMEQEVVKNCFREHLKREGLSIICEVKKASPSKGIIDDIFPYVEIAKEYEFIGADALSCLTEPKWFLGSDEIFRDIRSWSSLPMLRKDFVVDEYQLYEARCLGADAVLLICSILEEKTMKRYIHVANRLGLEAVVEAHDEEEVKQALSVGAQIIGVNNRNLKDFSINQENAIALRHLIPEELVFVAESGIRKAEELRSLREARVDAVLIGEAMMKAKDRKKLMEEFRRE